MRRKFGAKGAAAILAAAVCLSGCGNQTGGSDAAASTQESGGANMESSADNGGNGLYTEVGTYPIVTEPVTLSVFAPQSATITDFNTNEFTQYLEQMTGIDLEFEVAPSDSATEKVNLIMTGGDVPDVFLVGNSNTVPDENRFGIEEGSLIDLTDLIETQMPVFKKFLDETPGLREQITATDGKIYSLPRFNEAYHGTYSHKMWVNTKLLEEMGEEVPATTEDFYRICKAYKEQHPNGIPVLGGTYWNGNPVSYFTNAFTYYPGNQSPHGMVVADGTVSTMANIEEYREGLRYMRKLYEDGLLYEGSFTLDDQQAKALIASEGEPVLFVMGGASIIFIDRTANPELYSHYYPLEPLKGPEGVQYATYVPTEVYPAAAITSACEHPEAAARMIDYLYSLEGTLTATYGEKGEGSWGDAKEGQVGLDGSPALYEKYRPYSTEPQNAVWTDAGLDFWPSAFRFGEATDPDVDIFSPEGQEKMLYNATKELYEPHKPTDVETLPTALKLTIDESQEIQTMSVEVKNYYQESAVQFITGAMDLDKDWDTYVKGLEDMGMGRLLEVYQTAYDRIYK